jgi:hypothetical protein
LLIYLLAAPSFLTNRLTAEMPAHTLAPSSKLLSYVKNNKPTAEISIDKQEPCGLYASGLDTTGTTILGANKLSAGADF